jgi:hypothetical protein
VGNKQFGVQQPKTIDKISASATEPTPQRYGRVRALSTALAEREGVSKFIILPEFRVAKARRLGECPPAKSALPEHKDFP